MNFACWETMSSSERREYMDHCNTTGKDWVYTVDTETSRLPGLEESRVYIWQFHAEGLFPIYGRHLETFAEVVAGLTKHQIIWCHNLSFDMCYFWNILTPKMANGKPKATIRGSHRFQSVTLENGVTLQCSLIMYGTNLRTFMEQMNVPVEYQKTDMDYDGKYRDSHTPLTADEMIYCRNDVVGLSIAIRNLCDSTGDTVRTLPKTSTGFIRRDMKNALRITPRYNPLKKYFNDGEILKGLIKSFRGGNTHCNRWLTGTIRNCHSFDYTSEYPAAMLQERYPAKFFPVRKSTMKEFRALASHGIDRTAKTAHLYHVTYYGIECRYDVPIPYISAATLEANGLEVNFPDDLPYSHCYDNGRVLLADSVEMWLTELDAAIIESQYRYRRVTIHSEYCAEYIELPQAMKDVMLKYFVDKCQLTPDSAEYANSKRKLNGGYGMLAMNPFRESCDWNPEGGEDAFQSSIEELEQTFPYQWGVWVPLWGRVKLQEAIDCIDCDRLYYSDTDSLKFDGEIPPALTALNERLKQRAVDTGTAIVNIKGKMKYLGALEYEGQHEMKSLGAKKYVTRTPYKYIDSDGTERQTEFTITLAGANKKRGSQMIQSFDDFTDGLTIPDKLCPKYFDEGYHSVTLIDVGYKLSTTKDYKELTDWLSRDIKDELQEVYENG